MSQTQEKPKKARVLRYERFKQAAEEVFAERGYDGTTIREIAKRANCNLGTLSHYWNTKQALFAEIFQERFKAVFEYQMAGFNKLEAEYEKTNLINARDIIKYLVESIFVGFQGGRENEILSRKVFGRAVLDPSPEVDEAMASFFTPASAKLFDLLRKSCPHIGDNEFYWRTLCVIGSFSFVDTFSDKLTRYIKTDKDNGDEKTYWHEVAEYVTNFLVAGIYSEPSRK